VDSTEQEVGFLGRFPVSLRVQGTHRICLEKLVLIEARLFLAASREASQGESKASLKIQTSWDLEAVGNLRFAQLLKVTTGRATLIQKFFNSILSSDNKMN